MKTGERGTPRSTTGCRDDCRSTRTQESCSCCCCRWEQPRRWCCHSERARKRASVAAAAAVVVVVAAAGPDVACACCRLCQLLVLLLPQLYLAPGCCLVLMLKTLKLRTWYMTQQEDEKDEQEGVRINNTNMAGGEGGGEGRC